MWIEQLDVEGFRRISGTFAFAPTLSVVVGDNEAGKSSLHEALVRALYGFSSSERRRSKGSSLLERRAPWDGRPYRLVASLRDDGGEPWRVEWDFTEHRARLLDALGNDITDEQLPGRRFLGVELEDFRQVCCIDQSDLSAVQRSPNLGVALEEAVVQVTGDTPVEHAIERLNDFLRSVGARVDNLRPSPAGRLAGLIREREEVAGDLRAAEEARDQLVVLARDLAQANEAYGSLAEEKEASRQALLGAEMRELDNRLRKAKLLEEQAGGGPSESRSVPDEVRAEVFAARDRLRDIAEQDVEAEKETEAVGPGIDALETRQRELVAAVDALAPYADVDDSARDEIQAAWAELQALASEESVVAPEVPSPDPALERYRRERDDLYALASPQVQSPAKRLLWIGLVVASLGVAWLVRLLFRKARGKDETPLEERLRAYGASSLAELDARVEEKSRAIADAEAVAAAFEQQRAEHEHRKHELTRRIESALTRVGAPPSNDLEGRVQAYLIGAVRHGERRNQEADLERGRRELEQAKKPFVERDRLLRERQEAESRLRDAYARVGIELEDLDSAASEFERLLAEAEVDKRREVEAGRSTAALRSLLGDETLESLEQNVRNAGRAYEEHLAQHGELSGGSGERLGSIDNELQDQIDRVASLRTQAESLEKDVGDPAALKERLAALDERIARIEEAKDAVGLARESLGEAAEELRREFAPHLNDALRRGLGLVTGGRYSEAVVDGDLGVQVVVPETGQLKSADELSRATKDQLFLVERIEIARLLAPTKGSAPLLLDDPFAHYDHRRLRHGLELLGEAARERQIIVFTEDGALIEFATEVNPECTVIKLEAPTVPA